MQEKFDISAKLYYTKLVDIKRLNIKILQLFISYVNPAA